MAWLHTHWLGFLSLNNGSNTFGGRVIKRQLAENVSSVIEALMLMHACIRNCTVNQLFTEVFCLQFLSLSVCLASCENGSGLTSQTRTQTGLLSLIAFIFISSH